MRATGIFFLLFSFAETEPIDKAPFELLRPTAGRVQGQRQGDVHVDRVQSASDRRFPGDRSAGRRQNIRRPVTQAHRPGDRGSSTFRTQPTPINPSPLPE